MNLGKYLLQYNYEVIPAEKDGHCFISAICLCLECDHSLIFTDSDIKKLITYEVFQSNSYYMNFYDGTVLSMLHSLDRYIVKGVYTQQVVDIAVLAATKILCINMCIYKKQNGKAILYSQPSDPPSTCDVYLLYQNEHYDAIVSKEKCEQMFTFNITQEDLAAFDKIGTYFHITDPMDAVNGGKLYFVPPKDFGNPDNSPLFAENMSKFSGGNHFVEPLPPKQSTRKMLHPSNTSTQSAEDATVFVQNEETLENGVHDFNNNLHMDGIEEQGHIDEDEEEEVYDMFAEMNLTEEVLEQFQFEEDNSNDEDAVLDNSDAELENVSPLKPRWKRKSYEQTANDTEPKSKKELNRDIYNVHVTPPNKNTDQSDTEIVIDLTTSVPNQPMYESEQITSDSASFVSDSSSSTSRQKPHKFEKVKIDESRMARTPVKIVNTISWGVTGDHIYKVKCTEKDWIEKYEDGRWFYLRNSTHQGLRGKHRTGKCRGSFICKHGDCPKLTTEDIVNTIDFRRISTDIYVCGCCGYPAACEYCGCVKVVEFDKNTEILTYYHQGNHICSVKPNVCERRKSLENLPIPITGYTKPTKYMKECMQYYIDQEDNDVGFDVSELVCQDDVIAQIKKMKKHPNRQLHCSDVLESFSHINWIQQSLLKSDKDKYLIYKWECMLMGGKASYVFKTSGVSVKIAAMMGGKIKVGGTDSSLCTEPAFFDGMHTRVKFFVSLTLWIFHPAMWMMILLAVMDTPCEHSDDIGIFFDTFNKAVGDYLNEPEYIWDPFLIMMDHKGANFEALEWVYGQEIQNCYMPMALSSLCGEIPCKMFRI